MDHKQVVITRGDLKLSAGKLCAQVAHASLDSYRKADKKTAKRWLDEAGKKVVLKCKDLDEMIQLNQDAKDAGLPTALIRDAGLTEIPPGTVTCLGIGPDLEDKIDRITGHLKPL